MNVYTTIKWGTVTTLEGALEIGEEARLGRNVWGDREMGGPLALDGRRLMGGHNNPPKVVVDGERGVGEET